MENSMRPYRIVERFIEFGPGQQLGLKREQIAPRAHALKILQADEKKGDAIVETLAHVQFKAGEVIRMPDLPKSLTDRLVPLAEPTTPTEKVAVQKQAERRRAADKAKADKAKK
jgi:hypothetical protein